MRWTTANIKLPNYVANHEIYVGTQTGAFKKFTPAYQENPFQQRNLQNLSEITKESCISALVFGNDKKSEILIGRHQSTVEVHSLRTEQLQYTTDFQHAPIVGLARYDNCLVAGFANGRVQSIAVNDVGGEPSGSFSLHKVGDDMANLRQCIVRRNLVATGGRGRQNNLKVLDMAAGGELLFSSKNVSNDYNQLEVPVWDSDIVFVDSPHILATCSRYGYIRVYDTRKQRRPVELYSTEEQMSFSALTAKGNYIYTGTTMGIMKAFDIRRMKHFVHSYKGFTGGLSDVYVDNSGKYVATACLDRYVRVHHAETCVLMYQCYAKSKATRILLREALYEPNTNKDIETDVNDDENTKSKRNKSKTAGDVVSEDEEYDDMFEKMQTICETEKDEMEEEEVTKQNHSPAEEKDGRNTVNTNTDLKRKNLTKIVKNKRKKN